MLCVLRSSPEGFLGRGKHAPGGEARRERGVNLPGQDLIGRPAIVSHSACARPHVRANAACARRLEAEAGRKRTWKGGKEGKWAMDAPAGPAAASYGVGLPATTRPMSAPPPLVAKKLVPNDAKMSTPSHVVICSFIPTRALPRSEGGDAQLLPKDAIARLPNFLQEKLETKRDVPVPVRTVIMELDGSVVSLPRTDALRFKDVSADGSVQIKVSGLGKLFREVNLCAGDAVEIRRCITSDVQDRTNERLLIYFIRKNKLIKPVLDLSDGGKAGIISRAKALHAIQGSGMLLPPPPPEGSSANGYLFSCALEGSLAPTSIEQNKVLRFIFRCLLKDHSEGQFVYLLLASDKSTGTSIFALSHPFEARLAYDGLDSFIARYDLKPGDLLDLYAANGRIFLGWRKRVVTEYGEAYGSSKARSPTDAAQAPDVSIKGYFYLFTLKSACVNKVYETSLELDRFDLPGWAATCLATGHLHNVGQIQKGHGMGNSQGTFCRVSVATIDLATLDIEKHIMIFKKKPFGYVLQGPRGIVPAQFADTPFQMHFYSQTAGKRLLIAFERIKGPGLAKQQGTIECVQKVPSDDPNSAPSPLRKSHALISAEVGIEMVEREATPREAIMVKSVPEKECEVHQSGPNIASRPNLTVGPLPPLDNDHKDVSKHIGNSKEWNKSEDARNVSTVSTPFTAPVKDDEDCKHLELRVPSAKEHAQKGKKGHSPSPVEDMEDGKCAPAAVPGVSEDVQTAEQGCSPSPMEKGEDGKCAPAAVPGVSEDAQTAEQGHSPSPMEKGEDGKCALAVVPGDSDDAQTDEMGHSPSPMEKGEDGKCAPTVDAAQISSLTESVPGVMLNSKYGLHKEGREKDIVQTSTSDIAKVNPLDSAIEVSLVENNGVVYVAERNIQVSDRLPAGTQGEASIPAPGPGQVDETSADWGAGHASFHKSTKASLLGGRKTSGVACSPSKAQEKCVRVDKSPETGAEPRVPERVQHPVKIVEELPAFSKEDEKEQKGDERGTRSGVSKPLVSSAQREDDNLDEEHASLQEFHARIPKTKHLIDGSKPVASIGAAGFSNCPVSIVPLYNHVLKVLNQSFGNKVPKEYCWAEVSFENTSAIVKRKMTASIPDRERILGFLSQMNLRPGDELDIYIRPIAARNAFVFIALYANRTQRDKACYNLFDFRLPRNVQVGNSTWLEISPKALKLLSLGQLQLVEVRDKTHIVQGHVIEPKGQTIDPIRFDMIIHQKSCLLRGFHQLAEKFGTEGVFRASYSKERDGLVISYLCNDDVLAGSAASLMSKIAEKAGMPGIVGQKRKIDEHYGGACRKTKSDADTAQAAQALVGLQEGSLISDEGNFCTEKKACPILDTVPLPPPTAEDLDEWLRLPAMAYICNGELVQVASTAAKGTSGNSLCLRFARLAFLKLQKHFKEGRMKTVRDVKGEVLSLTLLPLSLQSASFERHFHGVHSWANNLELKEGDTVRIFQDNAGDLVLFPETSRKAGLLGMEMPTEGMERLSTRKIDESDANQLRFLFRKSVDDSSGSVLFSEKATSILQEEHPESGMTSFPRQEVGTSVEMIAESSKGDFVLLTSHLCGDNRLLLQGLQHFLSREYGAKTAYLDVYRGIHHEIILTVQGS